MLKRLLSGIGRTIMERTEREMECDVCGPGPDAIGSADPDARRTTAGEAPADGDGETVEPAGTPSGTFTVRPGRAADLPAARTLIAAAGLPATDVSERFEEGYAVAVSQDGRVIGTAGLEVHGEYGLLRSVAVDPAWRGRGLGAALTTDRLVAAADRGLDAVYLLTTTAEGYFPRFGFEPIERGAVPPEIQESSEFSVLCPSSAAAFVLER